MMFVVLGFCLDIIAKRDTDVGFFTSMRNETENGGSRFFRKVDALEKLRGVNKPGS
jgi:hypothetical protein